MRTLTFKKIDAFASKNSSGNPAAVIYLESIDDLSSSEMLQIAKELKGFVSEVGFVSPGTESDYQLRYFSSEREVAFCGHATIAILNDIVANDPIAQTKSWLSIATKTHRLMVENRYETEESVYISAPAPLFSERTIELADIAAALDCPTADLDRETPPQIVNAGLETLVISMAGLESVLSASPSLQDLNTFCSQIGVDIMILYSPETAAQDTHYRTRVFAPTFGYLEDPATGSGNAALGYCLLKHGKWTGEKIKIEQNGHRETPNYVNLYSKTTDSNDSRVWFGGGAIVKISGEYLLNS